MGQGQSRSNSSSEIKKATEELEKFSVEEVKLICAICREENTNFITRCNHNFHRECLKEWFDQHKTCP